MSYTNMYKGETYRGTTGHLFLMVHVVTDMLTIYVISLCPDFNQAYFATYIK